MGTPQNNIVIAGVGPGLGAALARKFASHGYNIGLLARNHEYLNQLVDEMNKDKQIALALPTDLMDPIQIESAFQQFTNAFGTVDILINHASGSFWKSVEEISPEEFEISWRIGTLSALLCSQKVIPDMLKKASGNIIFTGATSAIRGRKGAVDFSSSQFGRRGLADAMARELWPQGIHVSHVIIDGIIDTNRVRKMHALEPEDPLMSAEDIAQNYWHLVHQPRSSWAFEIAIRPYNEAFFE